MNIAIRPVLAAAALLLALPLAACAGSANPVADADEAVASSSGPAAAPSPTTSTATASTPLTSADPGGTPRLTVQITVAGGKAATVVVDTGSTGLFVNPDVVGSSAQASSTTYKESYLGSSLDATLTTGTVEIAGISTADPIVFGVVQPGASASIFNGLDGIMGIAPADGDWKSSGLLSPIPQLPSPYNAGFSIDATSTSGTFTVGAPARTGASVTAPLTALSPAPTAPAGSKWWAKDVQLCWTIASAAQACGPTDLDAGAPSGIINTTVASGVATSGDAVQSDQNIVIASPSGQQIWSVTSGDQRPGNAFKVASLGSQTSYNTGLGIFGQHIVGFDWEAGELVVTPAG